MTSDGWDDSLRFEVTYIDSFTFAVINGSARSGEVLIWILSASSSLAGTLARTITYEGIKEVTKHQTRYTLCNHTLSSL